MSAANWTEGQPEELARQFLALVGRDRSSLGPKVFLAFVKAITAASIYNVAESQPPSSQQQQLPNILRTAIAIITACKTFKPDRSERTRQREAGMAQFDAATAAAVATALAPGASAPKPLRQLQELVQQLLQQHNAAGGSAVEAGALQGAADAVLQVPRAIELYLEAINDANEVDAEMVGDGSCEGNFVGTFPLDGSGVAGGDLRQRAIKLSLNAKFESLAPILAQLAGLTGTSVVDYVKKSLDCNDIKRDPPHNSSSRLALFYKSRPVALHTSAAAAAAAAAAPDTGGASSSRAAGATLSTSAAAAAAAAPDVLAAASCDVRVLEGIMPGAYLHVDGDLLSYGFCTGYKQRDPGLGAAALSMGTSRRSSGGMEEAEEGDSSASALCVSRVHYRHGLFGHVGQVCADAGNALVWVAADDGARVKAFRAPASLGGPRCKDAACNRSDNGMELQYTFCCDREGENAGLHVAGTKVFAAMGSGALLTWDIAELAPQQDRKVSERALNWDDPMDEDDGSDIYVGDLDCRDTDGMDLDDLECSKGTAPHALLRLQRPAGADSCFAVRQTCLLAAAGAPDTLAAACSALYPHTNIVITYDLETQRAKRLLVGHLGEIMDISPAPASWHGAPHVFATASRSGDVKIWDVRSRGGAAAVTLGSASDRGMLAVALVAGSSSSSGSGSSRLGAGLCCFAGGLSQSVWAWDVRGGQGQALYELSTGNLDVSALAWHEPSSSLIASCDSSYEDRMGGCYREDFERVGGGSGGGDDEDEDDDESFDEDERWWPNKATHGAKDFPAYFAKSRSAVLCYTFSSSPGQQVPPSDEVYFAGGW